MEIAAMRRDRLRVVDGGDERRRQPIATTEYRQAYAVLEAALGFDVKTAAKQANQRRDFARRSRPVVGRERVQRQRADAGANSRFDDLARRANGRVVSGA